MTETDPYETDDDWLARHGALIREAVVSHLDEDWIARARVATAAEIPKLGATRRDAYYWWRWLHTVVDVFGRTLRRFVTWPIRGAAQGIWEGLKNAMRHPAVIVLVTLLMLFVCGFAAARL
jgi:hypothetical protein